MAWLRILRKQPTLRDAITSFPTKGCVRNERRISALITCHCTDVDNAANWLMQIYLAGRPIRSPTQIWIKFLRETSVRGESSRGVEKCRLFSPASRDTLLRVIL